MITFNYRPKYGDAVISLTNGGASGPTDGPISEWQFDKDKTPPSEEAIQAKLKELEDEYEKQAYARSRANAFPSLQEQLDMQYWDKVNGTNKWQEAVSKVKADNPKPE